MAKKFVQDKPKPKNLVAEKKKGGCVADKDGDKMVSGGTVRGAGAATRGLKFKGC